MAKAYFILLSRDDASSPWAIEFGDYDREVVADEHRDARENGAKASNMKLVTVRGDTQAAIDAVVARINAEPR